MKKLNLFLVVLFFAFSSNAFSQINLGCNGEIGIGRSPRTNVILSVKADGASNDFLFDKYSGEGRLRPSSSWYGYIGSSSYKLWEIHTRKLFVNGVEITSDERKKENIKSLNSGLDKILKINAKTYNLKVDSTVKSKDKIKYDEMIKDSKNHVGFLAQDLQKIIPEVVTYDELNDDYYVNYTAIIPYLVEAIKEQQTYIENLENEINSIKNDCCNKNKSNLKSAELAPSNVDALENISSNTLGQNVPNPFTESTLIEYFLSENVSNAMLNIYNMNGAQLKSIPLHQIGRGTVTINGGEFQAGMYMYTLIADGQVIDTKQMILTD